MAPNKDVAGKIIEIIAKQINKDAKTVNKNSKLVEEIGFDSLDVVEVLMKLEEDFGVNIPDEEAMKLKTVGDLISFVEKNM